MIRYVFRETPMMLPNATEADAQEIGEALNSISEKAGGKLTPGAVVEAAKSSRSVLHKHFQWEDASAAHAWRLHQARSLITSVRVLDDDIPGGQAPAFISISTKDGRNYHTLHAVKGDRELQDAVLAAAERDLAAWQDRYRQLRDVCALVGEARVALSKKRTKVKAGAAQA